tara:strand:- start:134 stop:361 length:228 start_codon:yes stop_codon:yes gene_type:complete
LELLELLELLFDPEEDPEEDPEPLFELLELFELCEDGQLGPFPLCTFQGSILLTLETELELEPLFELFELLELLE